MVAALLGCLDSGDHEVGARAVRDVGLGSVDDVAAVDPAGVGPDACNVGARARLGDAERGDPLAADRGREETPLLILRAELPDRRRSDADVGTDAGGKAPGPAARELLDEHGVLDVAAAAAAVLDGVLEPEQPLLRHAGKNVVRKPALPLPLEVGHDQVEAPVLLPQQVLVRHEYVLEGELGRVGRVPAELLQLLRDRDALHPLLDHEEGEAVVAALLGGL
ncbi:MAG TPA: hypothetical protein VE270_05260, partial [Thermoleophilaceae bacterium]|nr:hypothetical protein [Thermoleophilaceae bacterium]